MDNLTIRKIREKQMNIQNNTHKDYKGSQKKRIHLKNCICKRSVRNILFYIKLFVRSCIVKFKAKIVTDGLSGYVEDKQVYREASLEKLFFIDNVGLLFIQKK